MFFNPTEFGKSQARFSDPTEFGKSQTRYWFVCACLSSEREYARVSFVRRRLYRLAVHVCAFFVSDRLTLVGVYRNFFFVALNWPKCVCFFVFFFLDFNAGGVNGEHLRPQLVQKHESKSETEKKKKNVLYDGAFCAISLTVVAFFLSCDRFHKSHYQPFLKDQKKKSLSRFAAKRGVIFAGFRHCVLLVKKRSKQYCKCDRCFFRMFSPGDGGGR